MSRSGTMLVALMLGLSAALAQAEELTAGKRTDIEKFLAVSGALTSAEAIVAPMTQQVVALIKASKPDVSERVITVVGEELSTAVTQELSSKGGLTDQLVELYHGTFSHQEIRQLLQFYDSEIGRKVSATQPKLTQDAFQIGVAWGRQMGPRVQQRVRDRLAKEGIKY